MKVREEKKKKKKGFKLGNKNYVVSFKFFFFYLLKYNTKRRHFGPIINFDIKFKMASF